MNDYCEACDCDPCDCDGMETQDLTPSSIIYVYIPYGDILYVPRAASLCEARDREDFLEDKFDNIEKRSLIDFEELKIGVLIDLFKEGGAHIAERDELKEQAKKRPSEKDARRKKKLAG